MTAAELYNYLTAALARGLDPETTVVIDHQHVTDETIGTWNLVEAVEDPTLNNDDGLLWLTIYVAPESADPRFTPGHILPETTP
jgi:hypothetical protein